MTYTFLWRNLWWRSTPASTVCEKHLMRLVRAVGSLRFKLCTCIKATFRWINNEYHVLFLARLFAFVILWFSCLSVSLYNPHQVIIMKYPYYPVKLEKRTVSTFVCMNSLIPTVYASTCRMGQIRLVLVNRKPTINPCFRQQIPVFGIETPLRKWI